MINTARIILILIFIFHSSDVTQTFKKNPTLKEKHVLVLFGYHGYLVFFSRPTNDSEQCRCKLQIFILINTITALSDDIASVWNVFWQFIFP